MPGSPDIYPSPYIVASDHGYTKHIYAGTDRGCTKIGNGGIDSLIQVSDSIQDNANLLFNMQLNDISSRIIVAAPASCNKKIDGTTNSNLTTNQPEVLHTGVKPEFLYTDFHNTMDELVQCNNSEETARYFYHPDHLGSASWITDASGHPVQHMQYLPYGETLLDQRTASYSERYTFTGKEKDTETGYHYFGARYYSSDLSIWLSVDPMADKYPSLSPYNYCAWNPMKLVDSDGRESGDFVNEKGKVLGNDGKNDGKRYLLRTTKKEFDSKDEVAVNNISKADRKATEKFIKQNSGNTSAFENDDIAYRNSIEIEGDPSICMTAYRACRTGDFEYHYEEGGLFDIMNNLSGNRDGNGVSIGEFDMDHVDLYRQSNTSYKSWFHSHRNLQDVYQAPSMADLNLWPDLIGYVFSFRERRTYVIRDGSIQGYIKTSKFISK